MLQRVRNARRFVKSPHKSFLTRFRWMGSTFAVYDCRVQKKASRGDESPCARRSTKRRGGRGKSRSARKSRELTHADPETTPLVPLHRENGKRFNRRLDYTIRLIKKVVKLDGFYVRMKRTDRRGRENLSKNSLRKGRRGLVARIVRLVLSPGGSLLLAKARTFFLIEQLGSPVKRSLPSFTSWKKGAVGFPLPPSEVLLTYRDFTRHRARGGTVAFSTAVGQGLLFRVRLEACTPNPAIDPLI